MAAAAFQGIEAVAGADDLDRVAGLFPQARTNAARKSLNAALLRCARIATDKDRAVRFPDRRRQGAPPDARGILFAAIASVPSPKAIASLQSQLAAPSVDDRKDAIRALCSAHNPEADKLLLAAASQGTEPSEKILALRGYLDSIQAQNLQRPATDRGLPDRLASGHPPGGETGDPRRAANTSKAGTPRKPSTSFRPRRHKSA